MAMESSAINSGGRGHKLRGMRVAIGAAASMMIACGLALADEAADFGVASTGELRLADYAAPTPREVPGARTIRRSQDGTPMPADTLDPAFLEQYVADAKAAWRKHVQALSWEQKMAAIQRQQLERCAPLGVLVLAYESSSLGKRFGRPLVEALAGGLGHRCGARVHFRRDAQHEPSGIRFLRRA